METTFEHGLTAYIVTPHAKMNARHHQEIACNFTDSGRITYLLGTTPVTIEAGRWSLFWAAVPHHIIYAEPNAKLYCLSIPLSTFLHWGLPQPIVEPIMNGQMILDVRGDLKLDQAMFRRWCHDLDLQSEQHYRIVMLELEARMWRLSLYATVAQQSPIKMGDNNTLYPFFKAKQMAEYISQYYINPITVQQVAETVDLSRSQAVSLFRQYFQVSIGDYIKQYRVAHAQRLLVTTRLSLSSIAMRAGFTSTGQFYDIFKKSCHHTPKAYRSLFSIL